MNNWNHLNLLNSNSPMMEQLIFFHDHSMMILTLIMILTSYIMMVLLLNKMLNNYFMTGQMIEIIWTVLPSIILLFMAFPSLRLLYLLDEVNKPLVTLKTIGHQWYWSYEYSNFMNIEFDSYMIKQLNLNSFRLLETDNNITIPVNIQTRVLVSAADVIHAWTIPSLGIKVDATPGRLNQVNFLMNQSSILFGQCSEICGANHSFMPIKIESTKLNFFIKWIMNL